MTDPNTQAKRRKLLMIGSIVALVGLLALLGWAAFDQEALRAPIPQPLKQMMRPGAQVNDKEAFVQQYATQLKAIADRIEKLDGDLKTIKEDKASGKAGRDAMINAPSSPSAGAGAPIGLTPEARRLLSEPLPPAASNGIRATSPPPGLFPVAPRSPGVASTAPPPGSPSGSTASNANGLFKSGEALFKPAGDETESPRSRDDESALIRILRSEASAASGSNAGSKATGNVSRASPGAAAMKTSLAGTASATAPQPFVPANTFVRAALLNGLDAPTGGQAQSNPLPVSLHLLDVANLPSLYKLDVRDCRVLAAAFGDLSSERAMLRAETVTCVLGDGQVVEAPLRGAVVGEDGKVGIRGRLVTKQGQVLGNALLAGIASGIGRAFTLANTTQSVTPLGGVQTVDPGKALEAGAGLGVSRALDQLANYYIRAAEKLFPVIEIDGGRVVEVLITKGASVPMRAGEDRASLTNLLTRDGPRASED